MAPGVTEVTLSFFWLIMRVCNKQKINLESPSIVMVMITTAQMDNTGVMER